jgi:hypothetical protein
MADVDVCIIKGEDDDVEPLIDDKCVASSSERTFKMSHCSE